MSSIMVKMRIDKAGRVVVPKAVRDRLGLMPGDELEAEVDGDSFTLRRAHGDKEGYELVREGGILVFHRKHGEPITLENAEAARRQAYRERERRVWGPFGE